MPRKNVIGAGFCKEHPFNVLSRVQERRDEGLDEFLPFAFIVSLNFSPPPHKKYARRGFMFQALRFLRYLHFFLYTD